MPAASHDPLRPELLADFTGQEQVVRELKVILSAAKARGELPPHLLMSGPQGLGKTTLAGIIAAETGVPMKATSGPLLEKPADLVSLLISIAAPTVLFIDEVHRIPKNVEETLYTAMEDGRIDLVVPEGPRRARTIPMPLQPFVLVGATTRTGLLGGPFRDRFGHIAKLKTYDTATLAVIVARSANLLGSPVDEDAAALIASRSRGTPRIANHLLKRVRDYAHSQDVPTTSGVIDVGCALEACELFGVDELGLTSSDRELLAALCTQFDGGPVGVGTLAAAIGETSVTLEEVNEPYLMQSGLLARTPRGRVATPQSYRHLGLEVPARLAGDAAAAVPQPSGRFLLPPAAATGVAASADEALPGLERHLGPGLEDELAGEVPERGVVQVTA